MGTGVTKVDNVEELVTTEHPLQGCLMTPEGTTKNPILQCRCRDWSQDLPILPQCDLYPPSQRIALFKKHAAPLQGTPLTDMEERGPQGVQGGGIWYTGARAAS